MPDGRMDLCRLTALYCYSPSGLVDQQEDSDMETHPYADELDTFSLQANGVPGDPEEPGVPDLPSEPGEPTIPDQPPRAPVA